MLLELKKKITLRPPEGFTDLMLKLLSSKLNALETILLKIEESCNILECGNLLERISLALRSLETDITSGNQEIFDKIEKTIEKFSIVSSYLSLRSSIIKVLTISAGVTLILFSGYTLFKASSFLVMILATISAILSLSGMLLYRYFSGQILMIASAIFLAISPNILNGIIASISVALILLAISVRKGTKERIRVLRIEEG